MLNAPVLALHAPLLASAFAWLFQRRLPSRGYVRDLGDLARASGDQVSSSPSMLFTGLFATPNTGVAFVAGCGAVLCDPEAHRSGVRLTPCAGYRCCRA